MVKNGVLTSLDLAPLFECEAYLQGKMTKWSFTGKERRASGTLDLVHTDVCGPMNVKTHEGHEYFITLIDDQSRYGYVYLMHHMSETFERFKEFKVEVERQRGRRIMVLRSNRGGEYLQGEFKEYFIQEGIVNYSVVCTKDSSVEWCGRMEERDSLGNG